ncbi:hypothetical protein WG66_014026, partial [Moniliophthora roreri]
APNGSSLSRAQPSILDGNPRISAGWALLSASAVGTARAPDVLPSRGHSASWDLEKPLYDVLVRSFETLERLEVEEVLSEFGHGFRNLQELTIEDKNSPQTSRFRTLVFAEIPPSASFAHLMYLSDNPSQSDPLGVLVACTEGIFYGRGWPLIHVSEEIGRRGTIEQDAVETSSQSARKPRQIITWPLRNILSCNQAPES